MPWRGAWSPKDQPSWFGRCSHNSSQRVELTPHAQHVVSRQRLRSAELAGLGLEWKSHHDRPGTEQPAGPTGPVVASKTTAPSCPKRSGCEDSSALGLGEGSGRHGSFFQNAVSEGVDILLVEGLMSNHHFKDFRSVSEDSCTLMFALMSRHSPAWADLTDLTILSVGPKMSKN